MRPDQYWNQYWGSRAVVVFLVVGNCVLALWSGSRAEDQFSKADWRVSPESPLTTGQTGEAQLIGYYGPPSNFEAKVQNGECGFYAEEECKFYLITRPAIAGPYLLP